MKKQNSILFMSSLKFRDIELNLVQYIKKKKNLRSIFIVNTQEQKDFYLGRFSKYIDKIIVLPNELDILEKKELDFKLEKMVLKAEKKYKMTIFRLFLEDRIIGRGFHSTGGINHPETKLTRSSYKQVVFMAIKRIEFWENILSENNVKLTLNLPKPIATIAKNMNIRPFNLNIGKFEKRLIWTENPNKEPDNLEKEFKKNKSQKYKRVKIKEPHHNHAALGSTILKNFYLKHTFKSALKNALQSFKGKIKGQRKGKNIILLSELSYIWRRRNDFLELKKISNINLAEIKKKEN